MTEPDMNLELELIELRGQLLLQRAMHDELAAKLEIQRMVIATLIGSNPCASLARAYWDEARDGLVDSLLGPDASENAKNWVLEQLAGWSELFLAAKDEDDD